MIRREIVSRSCLALGRSLTRYAILGSELVKDAFRRDSFTPRGLLYSFSECLPCLRKIFDFGIKEALQSLLDQLVGACKFAAANLILDSPFDIRIEDYYYCVINY